MYTKPKTVLFCSECKFPPMISCFVSLFINFFYHKYAYIISIVVNNSSFFVDLYSKCEKYNGWVFFSFKILDNLCHKYNKYVLNTDRNFEFLESQYNCLYL